MTECFPSLSYNWTYRIHKKIFSTPEYHFSLTHLKNLTQFSQIVYSKYEICTNAYTIF